MVVNKVGLSLFKLSRSTASGDTEGHLNFYVIFLSTSIMLPVVPVTKKDIVLKWRASLLCVCEATLRYLCFLFLGTEPLWLCPHLFSPQISVCPHYLKLHGWTNVGYHAHGFEHQCLNRIRSADQDKLFHLLSFCHSISRFSLRSLTRNLHITHFPLYILTPSQKKKEITNKSHM